VLWERRDSA